MPKLADRCRAADRDVGRGLPHPGLKGANTIEYKIGEIFSEIENKFGRSRYAGETR